MVNRTRPCLSCAVFLSPHFMCLLLVKRDYWSMQHAPLLLHVLYCMMSALREARKQCWADVQFSCRSCLCWNLV